MNNFFKSAAIVAASVIGTLGAFTHNAEASVVNFDVSSAVSDPALSGSNNDHAIWLPFFRDLAGTGLTGNPNSSDFDFVWNGNFDVSSNGTATLTGRIASQVDPSYGFDIVFNLSRLDGPGSGGPKLELRDSAYASNGGPIDPTSWEFYSLTGGSFTGTENFTGLNFTVAERPSDTVYPFQFGAGANGKNGNLGASVWFYLFTDGSCSHAACDALADMSLFGDVNIDVTPVPIPAAFLLFGTGLAGMGAMQRRKRTVRS